MVPLYYTMKKRKEIFTRSGTTTRQMTRYQMPLCTLRIKGWYKQKFNSVGRYVDSSAEYMKCLPHHIIAMFDLRPRSTIIIPSFSSWRWKCSLSVSVVSPNTWVDIRFQSKLVFRLGYLNAIVLQLFSILDLYPCLLSYFVCDSGNRISEYISNRIVFCIRLKSVVCSQWLIVPKLRNWHLFSHESSRILSTISVSKRNICSMQYTKAFLLGYHASFPYYRTSPKTIQTSVDHKFWMLNRST